MGQQVRGRVAQDLETLRILRRDDPQGSTTCEVSTRRPSTAPASAARARPLPIDAAISATVTGRSKLRWLPSGSVITGMAIRTHQSASC
jgi:hypothetical protein